MIVRSHRPWPLRWVFVALMFGFSGASALWAYEFGQTVAGVEHEDAGELARLRVEVALLRTEREKVRAMASSAESLVKAEQAAQERLAQQIRQIEAENLALKADLGFFEQLLPTAGDARLNVRSLHAERQTPGQLRYQILLMQPGRQGFSGNYEVELAGTLDGRPWTVTLPDGARRLQFRQFGRVEGVFDHPPEAVVESVQVRVMDHSGGVRATQSVKL